MITVGITGKIASGKSSVCEHLKSLDGVIHIDIDKLVHEVLDYPEIRDLLEMKYPSKFRSLWHDYCGRDLRERLSAEAFKDTSILDFLEDITHVPLIQLFDKKRDLYNNKHVSILLAESAILGKLSHIIPYCHSIIKVESEEEDRFENFSWRELRGRQHAYKNIKDPKLKKKFDNISKRQDAEFGESYSGNVILLHNKSGCFDDTKVQAEKIINSILD